MSRSFPAFRLCTFLVVMSLLVNPLPGPLPVSQAQGTLPSADGGLYRTRVHLPSTVTRDRLDTMGVVVLADNDPELLVLVDGDQLTDLARLGFEPRMTDDLAVLLAEAAPGKAWLGASLQPLLAAARAVVTAEKAGSGKTDALATLRGAMADLSSEQRAGISALNSVDDDADGLTNTEEAWWCTDPLNANSDGDAQAYSDGTEVDALLDFTLSRTVRWGYGPPFGPPNAWPNFNDRLGTHVNVCNDGDYDTIPDFAEVFMVGSRVPNETTDGDKFDDGQELFGVTYCPGAPTNCGYGSYPAIEYWNYIKATMPNWVRPPGDNIFVAAFPVPEVSVVPGSWTVNRVTTITTTQGQMTQQTNSYETSVMRGQSTSIADTRTWNNWEEVSQSLETPVGDGAGNYSAARAPEDFWQRAWGGTRVVLGVGGGVAAGAVAAAGAALCLETAGGGCLVAGAAGVAVAGSLAVAGQGWQDLWAPNQVQEQQQTNHYSYTNVNQNNIHTTTNVVVPVILNQNFDTQGIVSSLDGVQYAINQQGELLSRGLQDISYQLSRPRFTETHTNGRSWGGAQTITNEVYEEHTITQGQAFTTGENWSTAWAIDSSHAADLTFTYTIKNTGTEYARELTGVIFNIYLGDDTTPIISYPAWQQFPNGKLENLFPADAPHQFASNNVPLTLEQMKRIDLGEPLRVVLEDFSYGADELFYQDAVTGGLTVFVEDGVDDNDETVDSYVIPTWGVESVQDVLTRYFPASYDVDGNLSSLRTPEFNGINPPTWHEHFLSDIAWWNIYLTQADAGNTPLKDLSAEAGGAILFRFNRDSDRDGYQDRVELRYGTDKDDPADHPQPEILAGYVKEQTGNVVTVKLVLENSGTFDAYGIDAVMYSPDDTTTIGNNTIGGNGKVRPGQHVAVGSLVKPPGLAHWGSSTAKPYSAGNYSGTADRTYTFSASTPGVVGTGSTALNWNDGAGHTGGLPVGASYHSPLPLSVSDGLEVGLTTGTIAAGASFTVTALTPRDTFTYTVNSANPTPPVIVVSYSDPQGSHRFITPVELPSLDTDLAPYTGQMLQPLGLEIATTGPVDANGSNTTNLVVNSPHPTTIEGGHLYVDFVADGTPVLHQEHTLPTIPPGPTVFPVIWATAAFTQTYDPAADNILLAHWTDSEGNIIDSAARPLNSFAADPTPNFAMGAADETWDVGMAAQGTALKRSFTLANTGALDLLTYISAPAGLSVSQTGSRRIAPSDMTSYEIALNTADLSVGPYDGNITIRTSDPASPTRTVHVFGTVTAAPADTPVGAMQRPLDWPATVSGTQGQWVEFAHTLGPEPQTLHPVKVYSQDYLSLKGVGKYATAFSSGTASYEMFGDGRDGDLVVLPGQTITPNTARAAISASGTSATTSNSSGFSAGDVVLIHQTQGTDNVGRWEFNTIAAINSANSWTMARPLMYQYMSHPLSQTCGGGYWGEYYNNRTLSGSPVFSRCDSILDFNWVTGSPGAGIPTDSFSVRWTGQIYSFSGTDYLISTCSDDGYRLYIDGQLSINRWQDQDTCYSDTRYVSAGLHSFVIEYYENGGNARFSIQIGASVKAQVIKVPQFHNVTVQGGGNLVAPSWDSNTGGILAMMCNETMNVAGSVNASGYGFRGASRPDNYARATGKKGESYAGTFNARATSTTANFSGGGGAYNNNADAGSGGGGGGYATVGGNGVLGHATNGSGPGEGGAIVGDQNLNTAAFFGGGGGSGSNSYTAGNGVDFGGAGGAGGGLVLLSSKTFVISGSLAANGSNGTDAVGHAMGGGGGGAGGAILLRTQTANLGSSLVKALGGIGGLGGAYSILGGSGGLGRIRVDHCETIFGSTNPPASTQQINCYIAEQIESAPYTTTRLNLPESGSHTYQVQYGRKLNWSGVANQVTTLRVPAGIFTPVTLQALVSDLPSNAWFALDVGNTGSDSWNGTVGNGGEYTSPNLAAYFNAYWASHGAPTTGYLDVPVRVYLDRAGQVLLTNLQVTPTGSKPRAMRLPVRPQGYTNVTASFTVSDGSGPLAVGVDVGDNGSVDWTYTGSPGYPANLTTGNLATAVNAYLSGHSGEVDVPIRFTLAPFATLNLTGFSATPVGQPDAQIGAGDVAFSATTPMETDPVTISTTLHNPGTLDSGGLTAAFFATLPNGQPPGLSLQVGAAYVPNIAAGGTASASIPWDTTSFTGTVPVRVVIDPYNRVAESNESNNEAIASLTILTRSDLQTTQIALSNPEPVTDEPVNVTLSVHNAGQTAAGTQMVALYDGNPDAGGPLIQAQSLASLAGGTTADMIFPWTPTTAGLHRLFARLDRDGQVNESDETNNDTWLDDYVGVRGPLLLDSGSITADPPYSTTLGFGYLNGEASTFCGTRPDQSQRTAPEGEVRYRFDHLLPGHFYHLDLTLFECDGAGRVEVIRVDDNQIGSALDLTDGAVHRVSILLDPAFYANHTITVGISETIGYDAIVARVNLYDVDYRFSDAGRSNSPTDPNDPAYPYAPPGRPTRLYGYLDGLDSRPWGTLPYQTRRIDLADSNPLDDPDNELRYQYDGLDAAKRYRLNLTFFQNAGGAAIQTVYADTFDTGVTVTLSGQQRADRTAEIPAGAYTGDGSALIRIVRTNAAANAFVNVLALEEITSLCDAPDLSCDGRVTVVDITLAAQAWNRNEMTIADIMHVAAAWAP